MIAGKTRCKNRCETMIYRKMEKQELENTKARKDKNQRTILHWMPADTPSKGFKCGGNH